MARTASTADLRRILPEPRQKTRAKILEILDELSIAFLSRCPSALIGTVGGDSSVEVSPKGDDPDRALLFSLRPFDPPRETVGSQGVARA